MDGKATKCFAGTLPSRTKRVLQRVAVSLAPLYGRQKGTPSRTRNVLDHSASCCSGLIRCAACSSVAYRILGMFIELAQDGVGEDRRAHSKGESGSHLQEFAQLHENGFGTTPLTHQLRYLRRLHVASLHNAEKELVKICRTLYGGQPVERTRKTRLRKNPRQALGRSHRRREKVKQGLGTPFKESANTSVGTDLT